MSRFIPSSRVSETTRARLADWQGRTLAALRIAFGLLWAISAWLTVQAASISALQHSLTLATRNSTLLASPWLSFWFHIAVANPTGFTQGIALLEGCVALGLLGGVLTNLTCGMGIALAILGWSTRGQALIAPVGLSALAGDPGIALICILACVGLSLSGAGQCVGLDSRLSAHLESLTFLASGRSQPASVRASEQPTVWLNRERGRDHSAHYPALSATGRTNRVYPIRPSRQTIEREQVTSARKRA